MGLPRAARFLYESRMPGFTVSLPLRLDDVPAKIKSRLRASLEEVAASLASLPEDGLIWDSMSQSQMRLDIGDWRFIYKVDRENERLIVAEALFLKDR
jgi:mRNA-degrading endonuclease RelE of RelBE toxin-antitoxin system